MGNFEGPPKPSESREAAEQDETRFAEASDKFFRERTRQLFESIQANARAGQREDPLLLAEKNRCDAANSEIFKFNHTKDFREAAIKDPSQLNDALTLLVGEVGEGISYFDNGRNNFDPDLIPEMDQRYADARQVFTDLGKRVFRDVPADASMGVLLRNARGRGSIDHPVLNSWHDYLHQNFQVAETLALRDSDPEALLKNINHMIWSAGIDINTARQSVSSEDDKQAIVETAKAVYALESLRADLEKQVAEKKKSAPEISASGSQGTASTASPRVESVQPRPQQENLAPHIEAKKFDFKGEPFTQLLQANTVEECRRAVTPEVMEAALSRALFDVDAAIAHAEGYATQHPGSILNKKTVALAFGIGVQASEGVVYQRIGAAKFGAVPNMTEVAGMPLVEFMKKYFDYDLSKDPERAAKLERYTNAFM